MTRQTLALTLLIVLTAFWQSCDDTVVEPGPFEYPINLSLESKASAVDISWEPATVSTFVEYLLVRATEPIPDTPEPELMGTQVIVERFEQVDATTFTDSALPISEKIYYKVFADIGDRFLISETKSVETDVQVFTFRVDAALPDPENHQFFGYDRARGTLYAYDYEEKQITSQVQFSAFNPVMRFGNFQGNRELYVTDGQRTLSIFDTDDLFFKGQFTNSDNIQDFVYANDVFIFANDDSHLAARRRQNFSFLGDFNSSFGQRRIHQVDLDKPDPVFVEVGFSYIHKYVLQNGNNIVRIGQRNDISGNGQLITAVHPDASEVCVNNLGLIMNSDLDIVTNLDNGLQFFNASAYSQPDGRRFITISSGVNSLEMKFYDVENDYDFVDRTEIGFFPFAVFADNENAYTVGTAFVNNVVVGVLNTYELK